MRDVFKVELLWEAVHDKVSQAGFPSHRKLSAFLRMQIHSRSLKLLVYQNSDANGFVGKSIIQAFTRASQHS